MQMFRPLKRKKSFCEGFSMVEMIVVVGIIGMIGGIMMFNYGQARKSQNLQIARDALQSALRQMQSNSLSGQPYPGGTSARDYGLKISQTSTAYETFVEQAGTLAYQTLEALTLPQAVSVTNLRVTYNGATTNITDAEIRFFPPFAEIKVTARNGGTTLFFEQAVVIVNFDMIYQGTTQTRSLVIDGVSGRID